MSETRSVRPLLDFAAVLEMLAGATILLSSASALAQILVLPRRAGQSRVRTYDAAWSTIDLEFPDLAAGSTLAVGSSTVAGGVRLFFSESGEAIARRAAQVIDDQYRELADEFDHEPSRRFPYVLYGSYREFAETNLFPIQEGILGITSPRDLLLTLPYMGDNRLFARVSRHELTHQFTIQKVRDVARAHDAGTPLEELPLWFIEGLAEYYGAGELEDETLVHTRDLVVNPMAKEGYVMLEFFDDRPGSGLWSYELGHVRCVFLEEVFGKGTLQSILNESPRLVDELDGGRVLDFDELVERVTKQSRASIEAKFAAWLKRRTFAEFLSATQTLVPAKIPVGDEIVVSMSSFGDTLLLLTVDPNDGLSELRMLDHRSPNDSVVVARDGEPGSESLHAPMGGGFGMSGDRIAFVAETEGADVLWIVPYTHSATTTVEGTVEVELELGSRWSVSLRSAGIVSIFSPAFSPDGTRLALVGLSEFGERDLYVLELDEVEPRLRRLTHDPHAERGVSWGSAGIVFTSDRTEHGRFNPFIVRTGSAAIERLAFESRDFGRPYATSDGRILVTAHEAGRAQIHSVEPSRTVRLTDVDTGLYDLGPGPDGAVWALLYHSGRQRPVLVPKSELVERGVRTSTPTEATRRPIPERSIAAAIAYDPWKIGYWRPDALFAAVGGGAGGFYGQVYLSASDLLRDHQVILSVNVSGSFDLTEGFLIYLNEAKRTVWGVGPFQWLRYRYDRQPDESFLAVRGERFFGVRGLVHHPLSRFFHLAAELQGGGAVEAPTSVSTESGVLTDTLLDDTVRAQGEVTLRAGYNTLRYYPFTGPVDGTSLVLESSLGLRPATSDLYALFRFDGERYQSIGGGRVNAFGRLAAGGSIGSGATPSFLLASQYTMRGVSFDDPGALLGRFFLYSTIELQLPLNDIVRTAFFPDIEGIAAIDFGGVADEVESLWDRRILDAVVGLNLGFGPIAFRIHFAWPLDIGAPLPGDGSMVTNLSLAWIYL
ncbi:MAG: tolB protein precursor protein [Deltaproteobacteria bacterium]|nr:tolB protein precursor protein [Deltaproteobacteria bacterium]